MEYRYVYKVFGSGEPPLGLSSQTVQQPTVMQALILLALVAASLAATTEFHNDDNKGNYNFGYNEDTSAGGSFRREVGLANGSKSGAYGVHVAGDDRIRIVKYVADENGFRATIQTNEPGVQARNPANVVIDKTPESDKKDPEADTEKAPEAESQVTHLPGVVIKKAPVYSYPTPVVIKKAPVYSYPTPVVIKKAPVVISPVTHLPGHVVIKKAPVYSYPTPVVIKKAPVAISPVTHYPGPLPYSHPLAYDAAPAIDPIASIGPLDGYSHSSFLGHHGLLGHQYLL